MRIEPSLLLFLHQLRNCRDASAVDRRRIQRVLRDADMQDALIAVLRERFQVGHRSLRELVELALDYGPELLESIADVVRKVAAGR